MAGRLRTKLDRYYSVAGESDPVQIEFPKGAYVPRFRFQQDTLQANLTEVSAAVSEQKQPALFNDRPRKAGNRRWRVAAYFVAGLLLVLSLGLFFGSRRQVAPFEQRPYRTSPLTDAPGRESGPTISPDGREIAFAWDTNGNQFDICLMRVDGTGLKRLTDTPDPEFSPAWSPDGRQIAFIRVRDYEAFIVVRPVAGGSERVVKAFRAAAGSWSSSLDPVFDDIGPVWSPDGLHLVYSDLTDQHATGLKLKSQQAISNVSRQRTTSQRTSAISIRDTPWTANISPTHISLLMAAATYTFSNESHGTCGV